MNINTVLLPNIILSKWCSSIPSSGKASPLMNTEDQAEGSDGFTINFDKVSVLLDFVVSIVSS